MQLRTSMHILGEVQAEDVPIEFMKQALSHLEAAERLNALMCEGDWPANFYRGRAVLWLAFHAVELFLKGCILKLDPSTKVGGHSLATLAKKLKKLAPDVTFDPPFGNEPLPPYPGLVAKAERNEKRIHEVLRYPTDNEGKPWPGAHGFSAPLFESTLAKIRKDTEVLYDRFFEGKDG